jgi:hypothetical protein
LKEYVESFIQIFLKAKQIIECEIFESDRIFLKDDYVNSFSGLMDILKNFLVILLDFW